MDICQDMFPLAARTHGATFLVGMRLGNIRVDVYFFIALFCERIWFSQIAAT